MLKRLAACGPLSAHDFQNRPLSDFVQMGKPSELCVVADPDEHREWLEYQTMYLLEQKDPKFINIQRRIEQYGRLLKQALFAVRQEKQFHEELPINHGNSKWREYLKFKKKKHNSSITIHDRLVGVLLYDLLDGRYALNVPNEDFDAIEEGDVLMEAPPILEDDPPPVMRMRSVLSSCLASRADVIRVFCMHAKELYQQDQIDYLCAALPVGRDMEFLGEEEEFELLTYPLPQQRGDQQTYWTVWPPKKWKQRWKV